MNSPVSPLPPYHARLEPAWIDYNGHLRDAYYGVVLSYAIDDLMDHLGLDAAYRERTHCTLYTLELHIHYLLDVKESDSLEVTTSILDADRKRIHAGCRFTRDPSRETVAMAEVMLLHVHRGDKPASVAFPAGIERRLESLKHETEAAEWNPRSRQIELLRRPVG